MNKKNSSKNALVITIIVFIIGLTIYYLQNFSSSSDLSANQVVESTPTPSNEDKISQSIRLCGDFPTEIDSKIVKQNYDVVVGPYWSPDCQNIAWSKWISGTSGPDQAPQPMDTYKKEGIYVYTPSTKQTKTVYQPKENNQTPELVGWDTDNILGYKVQGQTYYYNFQTGNVQVK